MQIKSKVYFAADEETTILKKPLEMDKKNFYLPFFPAAFLHPSL